MCVCACVGGDKPSESTQREALLTCTFDVFRFLIFFFPDKLYPRIFA